MTSDCAICYVSDLNFLLPSIISASSVRRFVPAHKANIFIFSVGIDAARIEEIDRFVAPQGIRVIAMDDKKFEAVNKERLAKSYTPTAMLGRFFMGDMLPASFKRIVYLDGDTWIEKDPSELIDAVIPEGRFAAAEDTLFYRQNLGFGSVCREARHYFDGLNLNRKNGYFNSGVFAVSRSTWKKIAEEAYVFYLAHTDACEHSPDQSALNAIMGDRRLRLSSRWNFQTQLRLWGVERYTTPRIYHFNRSPKPWMGVCAPWEEMYAKYDIAATPFAPLKLPLIKFNAEKIAKAVTEVESTYGYLKKPFVADIALLSMGYHKIQKTAWI